MENIERRFEAIERSLTPRQAFFLWMEEILKHQSFQTYVSWLLDHNDQRFDATVVGRILLTQRFNELKNGMKKDEEPAEILRKFWKGTTSDRREISFLYQLFVHLNSEFAECEKIALLQSRAALALTDTTHRFLLESLGCTSPVSNFPGTQFLTELATRVFTRKAALKEIQDKYFDGRAVLWKSEADKLADHQRDVVEIATGWRALRDLVQRFMGTEEADARCPTFDLESLERSVDPAPLVRDLVYPARISALQDVGKGHTALKFMQAWVGENAGLDRRMN